MRGSKIIYTAEDIDNIIKLYNEGYTAGQIALEFRKLGNIKPIKSIARKINTLGLYNENKRYKK